MKKHFICEISERSFSFRRNLPSIAAEATLDGIYVIRTSLDEQSMTAAECVRNYKRLCNVERAFRTIKTISLRVRPISSPHRRPGAGAYFPLHAGLLCGVEHARSLARAVVRRPTP